MSSFVFTSSIAPQSQATPELFRKFRIQGQIPGPVSESQIIPASMTQGFQATLSRMTVEFQVQCLLHKTAAVFKQREYKSILTTQPIVSFNIPPPPIVLDFGKGNMAESTVADMKALGFRKESQGLRVYYKGSLSSENLSQVLEMKPSLNTYAPYGAASIKGYFASVNLQKILFGICGVIRHGGDKWVAVGDGWSIDPTKAKSKQIMIEPGLEFSDNCHGLTLPYFQGLNIADKSFVPLFVSDFLGLFGDTNERAAAAMASFREGWRSLCSSQCGIALSHLAFCVDLALKTGSRPFVIQNHGQYAGVTLVGSIRLLKGITFVDAVKASVLNDDLKTLDSHSPALQGILARINVKLLHPIDESMITTPRALHNIIRELTLDTDEVNALRQLIVQLSFEQVYWKPLAEDDLLAAMKCMAREKFLVDSAPIDYRSNAMFTKDVITSTLSAFGTMAPSLIGHGNNRIGPLTQNTYHAGTFKGMQLNGVPIFVKPTQVAVDDWKMVQRTSSISFRTKVHSVRGKQEEKIFKVSKIVEFESKASKKINSYLARWTSKAVAKKRVRDGEEQDDEQPAAKKRQTSVERQKADYDLLFGFSLEASKGLVPTKSVPGSSGSAKLAPWDSGDEEMEEGAEASRSTA